MNSEPGEAATSRLHDLTLGYLLIQINFRALRAFGKNTTVCIFVSRVVLRQLFVAYSLELVRPAVVYSEQHYRS